MTEQEKKDVEKQMKDLEDKLVKETSEKIKLVTEGYETKLKDLEEKHKKEIEDTNNRNNEQVRAILLGKKEKVDDKSTKNKEDLYSFYDNGLLETCKYFGIQVKMKGEN